MCIRDRGHTALGCIDQQQNAVDHLQNALDLAAEVRVARGVDDEMCIRDRWYNEDRRTGATRPEKTGGIVL